MKHISLLLTLAIFGAGCSNDHSVSGPTPGTVPAQPASQPAVAATAAPATAPGGIVYSELPIKGRIYVFGSTESAQKAGAGVLPEVTVTKIGYGPNGETVVFEADKAHIENQLQADFDQRHPQK